MKFQISFQILEEELPMGKPKKRWFLLDTQTILLTIATSFALGFAAGYGVAMWTLNLRGYSYEIQSRGQSDTFA